ncbi:MAG: DUF5123 domain-containing protein [Bacteroides sp.]|nr:DUF5123 domain-containing protein [Bacteroides sp.]
MKIQYIYTLLFCAIVSAFIVSCDDDANEWPVDTSQDAPFRSIKFEWSTLWATSVEMSYTAVVDASKYIFEFSEGDSLLFNNIVRTIDILADTLTVYTDDKAVTKREYRTIFEDFKGTTRYSVRMKAIDKNNRETGYVQAYFDTPAEQVIKTIFSTPNGFIIEWDKEKEVTNIKWAEIIADQDTVFEERNLSAEEIADAVVSINDLKAGTDYYILLMKGDQQRGFFSGKTAGVSDSPVIAVAPSDNVNDLLKQQAEKGVTKLTLYFPVVNNLTYEIESLTIPSGIETIYFSGGRRNGVIPELYLASVTMEKPLTAIAFQNVILDARSNSGNYVFNIGNSNCFKNIYFQGCQIRNIGRSLIRLNGSGLEVESIVIDNCILQNIGASGYGMFNMGKDDMTVSSFIIRNTTMIDMGDQLMDIRKGLGNLLINQSIFCNYNVGPGRLFYIRAQPQSMTITNSIFTGTNNNVKIDASSNDASSYLKFFSCYVTSDLVVNNRPFTEAVTLEMTSEELFTDPRNGDFTIKEGVKFVGEGKAGDPRWW